MQKSPDAEGNAGKCMAGGWLGKHRAQGASSYLLTITRFMTQPHRPLNFQGVWIHLFCYHCPLARLNDGN